MLTVNKYREVLLNEFYLDSDDLTIRRKQDGWRGKYKKHDEVKFFKLCKHGYGGVHIPRTRATVSQTHLLTMLRGIDVPDGCVIDHIDGNSDNNARSNLRVTTQDMNCRNSKKKRNNTSGHSGISWNERAGCYITRKWLNGRRVYGGSSPTLEGALELMQALNTKALECGYTDRHGK